VRLVLDDQYRIDHNGTHFSIKSSTMTNTLTAAELKRRGMAAIEDGLKRGPVHIVKRNKPAAVVLTEADYLRLTQGRPPSVPGLTALQWLLAQPSRGTRSKQDIDDALSNARQW
jgi:hypothetical protein